MIENRLRDLREQNSIRTQEEMARFLGIKQRTYRKYENGEEEIPIKHARKLVKKYECSLDWLYKVDASKSYDNVQEKKQKFGVDIRDIISCKDNKIIIKISDALWEYFSARNIINAKMDTAYAKNNQILDLNKEFVISDNNIQWKVEIAVNMDDFVSFYNADGEKIPVYLGDNERKQKEPTEEELKEATSFFKRLFELKGQSRKIQKQ